MNAVTAEREVARLKQTRDCLRAGLDLIRLQIEDNSLVCFQGGDIVTGQVLSQIIQAIEAAEAKEE